MIPIRPPASKAGFVYEHRCIVCKRPREEYGECDTCREDPWPMLSGEPGSPEREEQIRFILQEEKLLSMPAPEH